jgi:pilus assembly protein Flp/PilA
MIAKLLAMKDAYLAQEDGATAIEYGLIAAGVSVAIAVVVFTLGDQLEALFTSISDKLGGAATP